MVFSGTRVGYFAEVADNGFVNADKEKMSKSLGNFVTLGDVLERKKK